MPIDGATSPHTFWTYQKGLPHATHHFSWGGPRENTLFPYLHSHKFLKRVEGIARVFKVCARVIAFELCTHQDAIWSCTYR